MADPVISVKLIVLYRFLSHNFPRSKTMWFLANSSIWHRKMLLNLTIPHPTTSLNVFLSQFPSFSSCLEQRTVWNTRGPFLVRFSFMKEQVFVPKTPNIFAIMTVPASSTVPRLAVWDLSRCPNHYCLIFLSMHQPVSTNQLGTYIINTSLSFYLKREEARMSLLFSNWNNNKRFHWHLLFGVWYSDATK